MPRLFTSTQRFQRTIGAFAVALLGITGLLGSACGGETTAQLPTMAARTTAVDDIALATDSAPNNVVGGRSRLESPIPFSSTLTADDGYLPDGESLSPFDTRHPAVTRLAPDLLVAIQQAATDAAAEGLSMVITSGWRSARYQQALLDDAIVTYGSEQEARKWVLTPETSSHVTGAAVDVGPPDAAYWLIQHGSAYGLCQTYANEIWHFELATEPGGVCPAPLDDASAR